MHPPANGSAWIQKPSSSPCRREVENCCGLRSDMSELTGKPYAYEFDVPASAIDANGHVNNVEFVRWMQDIAIAHADTAGCTAATREAGAMWLARSHHIEYRRPAFAGDRVRAITWLAN